MSSRDQLYKKDIVHYRGRDLLDQAIRKYDLPISAFYMVVISGALLLFSGGATLGAVLIVHTPSEHVILTFAALSSFLLIAVAASACFYWEHVSERRAALLSTLESYLDAQADVARYAKNREAH
tara:strand:- start:382 stop:753 length:372 start_codon:yes stop_codon:yes gene_type:complete